MTRRAPNRIFRLVGTTPTAGGWTRGYYKCATCDRERADTFAPGKVPPAERTLYCGGCWYDEGAATPSPTTTTGA